MKFIRNNKVIKDILERACQSKHQVYKEKTAHPSKYPQKYFKDKKCKWCDEIFTPSAPSNCFCSNDCSFLAQWNKYLTNTYAIDIVTYVSMFEKHNGRCWVCNDEGFLMRETHIMRLVVDHCHDTGKVRGLLCHPCNQAIGMFKENPEHILAAYNYLTK